MPKKKKTDSEILTDMEQARVDKENSAKPTFAEIESTDIENDVDGVAGKRLLSFFQRLERLEEEKAAFGEDIKDVFAEAKSAGFEVKIMRRIMKLRKMEIEKRREEDEILNLYMAAIGME